MGNITNQAKANSVASSSDYKLPARPVQNFSGASGL